MVGNEIRERGKGWILEGFEFCLKELVCRRKGFLEVIQSRKNQDQVVIQKDIKVVWGWVVVYSKFGKVEIGSLVRIYGI